MEPTGHARIANLHASLSQARDVGQAEIVSSIGACHRWRNMRDTASCGSSRRLWSRRRQCHETRSYCSRPHLSDMTPRK